MKIATFGIHTPHERFSVFDCYKVKGILLNKVIKDEREFEEHQSFGRKAIYIYCLP